jgi:hypothetical protein
VSPLKIKVPSKNMREKPTNIPIFHSVYDVCMVVPTCFGITLPSSGSVSSVFHNILSTAPQLSISQKTLGTLPEDGNIMPKHVGATYILNKLNEKLLLLLAFHAYINEMHG